MKYSSQNYSTALILGTKNVSSTELDIRVKNFLAQIVRNGDFSNISKILYQIEVDQAKALGGKVIDIEFAREMDRILPEELFKVFSQQDIVNIRINSKLIAGVRVTVNGEREFDNSLHGKLNKVFKFEAW